MRILFLISILLVQTAYGKICFQLFDPSSHPDNKIIAKMYNEILNEPVGPDYMWTFKQKMEMYKKSIQSGQSNQAVSIVNQPDYAAKLNRRYSYLLQRKLNPQFSELLKNQISRIEKLKAQYGDWKTILKKSKKLAQKLNEKRAPQIDRQNIESDIDIMGWHLTYDYLNQMILKSNVMKVSDLQMIIGLLSGKTTHLPWPMGILGRNDINFMYSIDPLTKKPFLNPDNSFLAGVAKVALMEQVLSWINENPFKLHPIILAAYIRQAVVSIHPIADKNGRLARVLSDYVLIKNGYFPAFIPKSTESVNKSVAIFTYKSFDEQISPEETVSITYLGVKRSYEEFEMILESK